MFSLINILNKTANITKLLATPSSAIRRVAASKRKDERDLYINKNDGFTFYVSSNKHVIKAKHVSEINLPLPITMEYPTLITTPKVKIKQIYGLMSFTEKSITLLENSNLKSCIFGHLAKVIYNFFGKKKYDCFEDCIINGFENLLGGFQHTKTSDEIEVFGEYGSRKYISFIQHIGSFIFEKVIFKYNILETLSGGLVNVLGFINSPICFLNCMEVYVLRKTLASDKYYLPFIYFTLYNPEFPFSAPKFSEKDCMKYTNQKNPDVVETNLKTAATSYDDVKTYSPTNVTCSRLSVFHPTEKNLMKEIHNVKTGLMQIIKKKQITSGPLKKLYDEISFTISVEDLTPLERFRKALKILIKAKFNKSLSDLPISLSFDISSDTEFEKIYHSCHGKFLDKCYDMSTLQKKIIKPKEENLIILEDIENFSSNYFPEEIKETIKHNLKLIEYST